MCKYGILEKKDTKKDELAYVDNPVESEFPGHWLPLSILKKILEKRAQTPSNKQTLVNLKLDIHNKYITTGPYTKHKRFTAKKLPTKAVIKSLIPNKEYITTNNFKTSVILSSTAVKKDTPTPFELSKLITEPKTNKNSPETVPETAKVTEKEITITKDKIIDEETTETTTESTPSITTKITTTTTTTTTTKSIATQSEKPTAESQTVSTVRLTEATTTELRTESTTEGTTEKITEDLNKSTEPKKILTTRPTTTTTTETGNPFY